MGLSLQKKGMKGKFPNYLGPPINPPKKVPIESKNPTLKV